MALSGTEKKSHDIFSRFNTTHTCDRQTDRDKTTASISLCIASRGKNQNGHNQMFDNKRSLYVIVCYRTSDS